MWLPRLTSLVGATFVTITLALSPVSAGPAKSAPLSSNLPQAINSGVDLELSKKWIEAITHYEKAIKLFPENKDLELGLRRSKIQFSIERRYTDSTFHKTLLKMPQSEAQSLFNEVLNQVQHDYVESVTHTSFVAHGTESLYLSLANTRFQQANIPAQYRNRIDKLRDILNHEYWNKPIASRDEALRVVQRICQLGAEHLGMQPTPIILEYVFGGCNALDDYSTFLTPGRYADLYANIEGQFVGLGVEIKAEAGQGLLLVNVLPDSPAAEGGLLKGEHIVAIDGTDVRDMTTDAAAGMLQGLEGTRVTVDVAPVNDRDGGGRSGGRSRRLSLVRRAVVVKSIPVAKIIDTEAGVGYIQMTSFQKSTVQEFDAAMNELRQQGMRSLVWDLRGNPGGLLTTAVEVLDRLIPEGTLVSTRGRVSDQNTTYAAQRRKKNNVPLVLLIDGDSASASEIVAGAVKDYRRGTIVGRKSYGKWSVQEIRRLRSNCALKLTTAKFYSPKGHTLGKVGVRPDIEVPEPEKPHGYLRGATEVDVAADADLQKALEVLQKRMASR
ncbi:MAG: PDZ domain-containing protein [Planctomycetes bacterium]|nr:PDZ domain-containing protein [Planctomycetota bacterium]